MPRQEPAPEQEQQQQQQQRDGWDDDGSLRAVYDDDLNVPTLNIPRKRRDRND